MKKYPLRYCLLFCVLCLAAYEYWQYSSPLMAREWVDTNIRNIAVRNTDVFSFAVFGDNKNSKFVFETLIRMINHDPDILFAMDLGDLVCRGEKREYRYFLKQVSSNLHKPFLTAPGNHDAKGEGRSLYKAIFGPFYYSFRIGENYFIVLDDSNRKGIDTTQKQWLEKELIRSQKYSRRFLFMHIPLYKPEEVKRYMCLPREAGDELLKLFMKYRVTHIFASHIHGHLEGNWGGIPYIISGGAGAELAGDSSYYYFFHYTKVQIKKNVVEVRPIHVSSSVHDRLGRNGYMA